MVLTSPNGRRDSRSSTISLASNTPAELGSRLMLERQTQCLVPLRCSKELIGNATLSRIFSYDWTCFFRPGTNVKLGIFSAFSSKTIQICQSNLFFSNHLKSPNEFSSRRILTDYGKNQFTIHTPQCLTLFQVSRGTHCAKTSL